MDELSSADAAALTRLRKASADDTRKLPALLSEAETYESALALWERDRELARARVRVAFEARRASEATRGNERPTIPARRGA
jgi:hypothetical protein